MPDRQNFPTNKSVVTTPKVKKITCGASDLAVSQQICIFILRRHPNGLAARPPKYRPDAGINPEKP